MPFVTRSQARKRTAQIAFTPQNITSQKWWNEYLLKVENLMVTEELEHREALWNEYGIHPMMANFF